jgi:hypothetical protein
MDSNATLIAVAPELLDTCEKILASCEVLFKENHSIAQLSLLKTVITKVKSSETKGVNFLAP